MNKLSDQLRLELAMAGWSEALTFSLVKTCSLNAMLSVSLYEHSTLYKVRSIRLPLVFDLRPEQRPAAAARSSHRGAGSAHSEPEDGGLPGGAHDAAAGPVAHDRLEQSHAAPHPALRSAGRGPQGCHEGCGVHLKNLAFEYK